MALTRYLAMTGAEFAANPCLPPKIAWMACHFSPYSTGLSNLPCSLPPDSLLILNDSTPIHRHDPSAVGAQLRQCTEKFRCRGVLLDFQRPGVKKAAELAKFLSSALPCPVAVSEHYARDLTCPVFLSPVPCYVSLEDHLKPWKNRDIWLELALDREIITLTEEGAAFEAFPGNAAFPNSHADDKLHCHYHIELLDDKAEFTLWRTGEDLDKLMEEAEKNGISLAVGLYQELGK